jgi:mono/diheme cytochrome c family protein
VNKTVLLIGVFVAAASAAQRAAPNLNLPSGDARKGEGYYLKYGCWECHGYTGQTGNGAHLAGTSLKADAFVSYIRGPRTNQMPRYSAKLIPDQEASDLFTYIKTFKKPPDVRDIPLLNEIGNEQK